MRSFSPLLAGLALLCACPKPPPTEVDGGLPPPDAGQPDAGLPDAGKPDAGKPDAGKFDAGFDAGFLTVAAKDWCDARAFVECVRDARCLLLDLAHLAECLPEKAEYCDQTAYTRAVAEGRLDYRPAKAAECVNAFGWGSCTETPAACRDVFTGQVPPDGGCVVAEECNGAGYCYQYDNRCPHRCLPYLPLGSTCDGFSTLCEPDAGYCGTADGGGQRCLPLKNAGEACPEYDACRAELSCANSLCVKRYAGPGESCGESSGFPYCDNSHFCRQDQTVPMPLPGTCEARGGLGAVCAGYGSCLPSLRCQSSFVTSVCIPRTPVGGACSNYGDCQETLYCHPRQSRCLALPGDGGDCTSQGSYFECASAHFCDFNVPDSRYTCRPRRQLDESCTYDAMCLSNECEYGLLPDAGYGGRCIVRCSQRADGGF